MHSTRIKEREIRLQILFILFDSSNMAIQEIARILKSRIKLHPDDLARANERPNECKFDQKVANALQSERFLCANRLVRRVGRGIFEITERGRKVVANVKSRQGG